MRPTEQHAVARRIFEEIRERPYAVSVEAGVAANNCYYKGIELLQRLGCLGYAVRGCTAETFWDETLIPPEIHKLYPPKHLVTHFYVEAEIDGAWRILDPSFDPVLEKAGFRIGQWDSRTIACFTLTKIYDQKEQIAYTEMWNDPVYAVSYFLEAGPFLRAFNTWLDGVRKDLGS